MSVAGCCCCWLFLISLCFIRFANPARARNKPTESVSGHSAQHSGRVHHDYDILHFRPGLSKRACVARPFTAAATICTRSMPIMSTVPSAEFNDSAENGLVCAFASAVRAPNIQLAESHSQAARYDRSVHVLNVQIGPLLYMREYDTICNGIKHIDRRSCSRTSGTIEANEMASSCCLCVECAACKAKGRACVSLIDRRWWCAKQRLPYLECQIDCWQLWSLPTPTVAEVSCWRFNIEAKHRRLIALSAIVGQHSKAICVHPRDRLATNRRLLRKYSKYVLEVRSHFDSK